jgi:hypothetical protein
MEKQPIILTYRDNEVYRALAREIEARGREVEQIVIPKGTNSLPESVEKRLREVVESEVPYLSDRTMIHSLKRDIPFERGKYIDLQRILDRSEEGDTSTSKDYEEAFRAVAGDAKEQGIEEMVVVLAKQSIQRGETPSICGLLTDHGICIEGDKKLPKQDYWRRLGEVYSFVKKAFEDEGLSTKPGIAFEETISMGEGEYKILVLEDVERIDASGLTDDGKGDLIFSGELTQSKPEQGIFYDRHASGDMDIQDSMKEKVTYSLHEGTHITATPQGSKLSKGYYMEGADPEIRLISEQSFLKDIDLILKEYDSRLDQ